MAESSRAVFAFNVGEVDPDVAARSDLERLGSSCRTLQNMRLGVFGYAERRQGLKFVAAAKVYDIPGSASPVSAFDLAALQLFEDPYADRSNNYDFLTVQVFNP